MLLDEELVAPDDDSVEAHPAADTNPTASDSVNSGGAVRGRQW
jgi:hypothetical protein